MTLRLGLLAASQIAQSAIVQPAAATDGVAVVAIAARSEERARTAAGRWGIPGWFGSYEEMLASDEIDAVYISTPAALHREWTIAAIDAGKHVLCEKPLAANATDARLLADAANATDLVVMEALHWRYHPLVKQMRTVLDAGTLGEMRRVEARFMAPATHFEPMDIRWDLALGGGAMMDVGVYPANWVRWAVGSEPAVVSAEAACSYPEVDGRMEAELVWDSGVTGSVIGSMMWPGHTHEATLRVLGTAGSMTADNPLTPQGGAALYVDTENGRVEYEVSRDATYLHQLGAFRDAIVSGAPYPTTPTDGVKTMDLIDACYRAAGMEPRPSRP